MRSGSKEGQSILVVRVEEANPFQANLSVDNYSPPSIGSERLGINARYHNLTGNGDAGGVWGLRSLFSFGTGTLDATINPDPIPDGRFFSWLGQVQRVQTLNDNNLLILQADVQLTPNGLLPSQQFVIGGGQSVRGYRQNVRAGDNGVRFSIENRITLQRDETGN